MISRFEFIESFDARVFAFAGGAGAVDVRPLQILYALAGEIRPRATLLIGAGCAYAAGAFVAMLNAGFIEEAHFIDPAPTDRLHCVLAHARIAKRTHLYGVPSDRAPLIDADFLLLATNHTALRDVERAFSMKTAVVAVADPDPAALHLAEAAARLRLHPEYTPASRAGFTLGLRPDRVSEDTLRLSRDLVATEQVWWPQS